MSVIAVDFDGTLVDHRFPDIGDENPGAIDTLKALNQMGYRLILLTMRSGEYLKEAIEWAKTRGITFWGINSNPDQLSWTSSPKVYANIYIDDAAFGCPLRSGSKTDSRPMVDWSVVRRGLVNIEVQ